MENKKDENLKNILKEEPFIEENQIKYDEISIRPEINNPENNLTEDNTIKDTKDIKDNNTTNINEEVNKEKQGDEDFSLNKIWRAKLYQLNAEGTWDEKGLGYVQIKYLKKEVRN